MRKAEILEIAGTYVKDNLVQVYSDKMTIRQIYKFYKENNLILQDWFQRGFSWTEEQKVLLIHSLLNMPKLIPQVVLFKEQNLKNVNYGTWVVADGQQRLTTIIYFLDGLFQYKSKDLLKTTKHYSIDKNSSEFEDCCEQIMNETLDVVKIINIGLNEEQKKNLQSALFHKWNSGTNLTAAEKRGANNSELNIMVKSFISEMDESEKKSLLLTSKIGKNKVNEVFEKIIYHILKFKGSFNQDPTPS